MKKIIALLLSGTFIIASAVAQTETSQPAKGEKKEMVGNNGKQREGKDADDNAKKKGLKKKHHTHGKGKAKGQKDRPVLPEKQPEKK